MMQALELQQVQQAQTIQAELQAEKQAEAMQQAQAIQQVQMLEQAQALQQAQANLQVQMGQQGLFPGQFLQQRALAGAPLLATPMPMLNPFFSPQMALPPIGAPLLR